MIVGRISQAKVHDLVSIGRIREDIAKQLPKFVSLASLPARVFLV